MKLFSKFNIVLFSVILLTSAILLLSAYLFSSDSIRIIFTNEDSVYTEITVANRGELILPEAPQKSGHVFCGWYFDNTTFSVELTPESLKESDLISPITVYAKFEPMEHIIKYVGGGTHSNPDALSLNVRHTLTDAKKSGYLFEGWFTDASYKTKATELYTKAPKITTLYAKWTPIEYHATFKNNGIIIRTVPFTVETSSLSEPELPQIVGYEAKWEPYTLSANNLTINAEYTPIVYKITYQNAYGISNPNPTEYTIESSTIKLSAVQKGGLTFEGWYVGNTLMEEIPEGSYGDIILVAKWDHFMIY